VPDQAQVRIDIASVSFDDPSQAYARKLLLDNTLTSAVAEAMGVAEEEVARWIFDGEVVPTPEQPHISMKRALAALGEAFSRNGVRVHATHNRIHIGLAFRRTVNGYEQYPVVTFRALPGSGK